MTSREQLKKGLALDIAIALKVVRAQTKICSIEDDADTIAGELCKYQITPLNDNKAMTENKKP